MQMPQVQDNVKCRRTRSLTYLLHWDGVRYLCESAQCYGGGCVWWRFASSNGRSLMTLQPYYLHSHSERC